MKDSLASVQNNLMRQLIGNFVCGVAPVVAINAGSALTVKSSNTISYSCGGLMKTISALSAQALNIEATVQALNTGQPTFYTQPANTTVYYILCADAAGNVKCIQGTYAGQLLAPYQMEQGMGNYPIVTNAYTPFAILKQVTAATTWLCAGEAIDKAACSPTFRDINMLPTALI